MMFVIRTWPLLTFGLFAWAAFPWIWRRVRLPYDDVVAEQDVVIAQQYCAIYGRAVPKVRRLWVLGGATAILDYALEASSWQQSNWTTITAVPLLRIVAALLIGAASALALDLVFREVDIAVQLVKRNYEWSKAPWLVRFLVILLRHTTLLVGLSLVIPMLFVRYCGITTDTIVGVAVTLIVSRYVGFVSRELDVTQDRSGRSQENRC